MSSTSGSSSFRYFSHNGKLLPIEKAVIPIDNLAYSYGFGVYETIRVVNKKALFLTEHVERLIQSAKIIGLSHQFSEEFVENAVISLIDKIEAPSINCKLLLIGGDSPDLYINCHNPHFPDRKLYASGVSCITRKFERVYPQAKSLNMQQSYIAFSEAKKAGAFEALLVNSEDEITEGTRSNVFGIKDNTLYSPPSSQVLLGVTRKHVIEIGKSMGLGYEERPFPLDAISDFENIFITSTSFKIMPIRSIDSYIYERPISETLKDISKKYDEYIKA
ncbi:MAG: aminotransferase class IV [Candidatus Saccharimonadales bacterium]